MIAPSCVFEVSHFTKKLTWSTNMLCESEPVLLGEGHFLIQGTLVVVSCFLSVLLYEPEYASVALRFHLLFELHRNEMEQRNHVVQCMAS